MDAPKAPEHRHETSLRLYLQAPGLQYNTTKRMACALLRLSWIAWTATALTSGTASLCEQTKVADLPT